MRYSYFKIWPWNIPGQGHEWGHRSMSHVMPSIQPMLFLFVSHQSDKPFLRYSYLEILPWNIQGQGHEWGQRSRSYVIPSTQSMLFLFISHQSDQPFLRYGQNSVWPWNKANLRDLIAATGLVILRKLDSNRRLISLCDLEIWWPKETIGHFFYATLSFAQHFKAIGIFKLEVQCGNVQFGSKLAIFCPAWPWKLTDYLEHQ